MNSRTMRMTRVCAIALCFGASQALWPFQAAIAAPVMSKAQIRALVKERFGNQVAAMESSAKSLPPFRWLGQEKASPILVVPVAVDAARGTLNRRSIKLIPLPGNGRSVDDAIGGNCLGLAFFHGINIEKTEVASADVHLLYDCFSGYARVGRHSRLMQRFAPKAAGDGIVLDLESGGQLLVYWQGNRYLTTLTRLGD